MSHTLLQKNKGKKIYNMSFKIYNKMFMTEHGCIVTNANYKVTLFTALGLKKLKYLLLVFTKSVDSNFRAF